MFVTVTWIATEAPWLISIMAITAATPIMMPNMVSAVRIRFRRKASQANRTATAATRRTSRASRPRAPDGLLGRGGRFARRGRVGHDPPVDNANHAIGVIGHVGIVRDQQDGNAAFHVQAAEDLQNLLAGPRIEIPRRLVGQQHDGLVHQRAGDGHPLLFATRQLRRRMIEAGLQADGCQQLPGPLLHLPLRRLFDRIGGRHPHVLQGRDAGEQIEALKHETDAAAAKLRQLLRRKLGDLDAVEAIRAGGGPVQATQQIHERGLTRARGAHQGHELSAFDGQRDILEHRQVHVAEPVRLVEMLQFDQCHGGRI